jgi:hypothetical protein
MQIHNMNGRGLCLISNRCKASIINKNTITLRVSKANAAGSGRTSPTFAWMKTIWVNGGTHVTVSKVPSK